MAINLMLSNLRVQNLRVQNLDKRLTDAERAALRALAEGSPLGPKPHVAYYEALSLIAQEMPGDSPKVLDDVDVFEKVKAKLLGIPETAKPPAEVVTPPTQPAEAEAPPPAAATENPPVKAASGVVFTIPVDPPKKLSAAQRTEFLGLVTQFILNFDYKVEKGLKEAIEYATAYTAYQAGDDNYKLLYGEEVLKDLQESVIARSKPHKQHASDIGSNGAELVQYIHKNINKILSRITATPEQLAEWRNRIGLEEAERLAGQRNGGKGGQRS